MLCSHFGFVPGWQAAQRALVVAREKAANEAKSEFMSLMCHEVRTPLNGCLASAEMLLETDLKVPHGWEGNFVFGA
jgi:signal transduction histidine kinase